MKIDDTKSVGSVPRVRRERKAAGKYEEAQARQPQAPSDTVSLMGIPEAELTPKVRAAIMTLMKEVSALREEIETNSRRIGYLELLAHQDTLVPVANRRAFVRELTRVISYSERYDEPASLVYFDLNGFKQINDTLGHAAGDAALKYVARTLMEHVRESDTVGRLGGDEFGVVLWRMGEREALEKASELAEAISAHPVEHEGHSFVLRTAHGATTFRSGRDAQQWMADADEAMYRRKAAMKSQEPGGA